MPVAPPRPRDLPLSALRAFEAAARLGGFVAAAQELGVTPGAVTAHIKALEEALGAALFERGPRGVRLTALGARAAPGFVEAFDALGEATRRLRGHARPQTIRIAALPALAQLWLSQRLPAIREAMPELEISITAMETPPNLKRSPYDLCLFFDEGRAGRIAEDVIFPVCAPAIAGRLRAIRDLADVVCLSDATWSEDWRTWLDSAAPGVAIAPRGPEFSLYALAVEEALNGAGVLMGHEALIARHLESGALVAPFAARATTGRGLRLWSARPMAKSGALAVLADRLCAARIHGSSPQDIRGDSNCPVDGRCAPLDPGNES